jgi:hypothetical protein
MESVGESKITSNPTNNTYGDVTQSQPQPQQQQQQQPQPQTTTKQTPLIENTNDIFTKFITLINTEQFFTIFIIICYAFLLGLYYFTQSTVTNIESSFGTKESKTATYLYFYFTIVMFFLFFTYKILNLFLKDGIKALFNKEDLYFIIFMFIYFGISIGVLTNKNFNWVYISFFILGLTIFVPFFYKVITDFIFKKETNISPDKNFTQFEYLLKSISDMFYLSYNFYVSYAFLFTSIILIIIICLSYSNKYNIPNVKTLQMWGAISSIIFGVKYFLLNNYSTQNPILIFIFLGILSILTYFTIIPSEISQITLTIFFTLSVLLFSFIVPTDIPYLSLVFFIISVFFSIFIGLKSTSIRSSTMKVFFIICSLYIVILFSNKISTYIKDKEKPKTSNPIIILFLYIIFWIIISSLYFTNSFITSWKLDNSQIASILLITFTLIIPIFTFGGIEFYNTKKNGNWSESNLIGLFFAFIGFLISSYYILNKSHSSTNIFYTLLFFIFFISNIFFMFFNLKIKFLNIFIFICILLIQILSVWLIENKILSKNENGSLTGIAFLFILWIGFTVFFWHHSGITIPTFFNITIVNVLLSVLMIYLIFYYIYLAFDTKQPISQRFSQIMLIIMLSYLLLQIFKTTEFSKNPFVTFLINGLEIIPCFYEDFISSIFGIQKEKEDFSNHPLGSKILGGIVFAFILYSFYPYIKNWVISNSYTPGVELIGNKPLNTNNTHLIKTYEELTNSLNPIYNYGISFYIYITPTSGPDENYNLINFIGNLFISYNIAQNQLYIYCLKNNDDLESIYRYNQFPLQKWVKIEINYVGGTYDVFVDGVIKTSKNIVSYNTTGNIFVGEEGSLVVGKVRDFMYYKNNLTLNEIKKTK